MAAPRSRRKRYLLGRSLCQQPPAISRHASVIGPRTKLSLRKRTVTTIPDLYAKAYRSDAFPWQGVTPSPANGLPMVRYPGFGLQWNYVTVALYGLQRWSDWLYHRGGSTARAAAIKATDFLVSRQGPDGAWRYAFPFTYDDDAISESLPAG